MKNKSALHSIRNMEFLSVSDVTEEAKEDFKAPGEASGEPDKHNIMTSNIAATGRSIRQEHKDLKEQAAKFEEMKTEGLVVMELDIHLIDRPSILMRSAPYWLTERFQEIKTSIKTNGLHEPITVRPSEVEGRYLLVKGDTRLTSFEQLYGEGEEDKWLTIPARVQAMTEKEATRHMIIENVDRESVYAFDLASYFVNIQKTHYNDDLTLTAEGTNSSKGWLSKLKTINTIPEKLVLAFPRLYELGSTRLYNLAREIDEQPAKVEDLISNAETLARDTPLAQVAAIMGHLKANEKGAVTAEPTKEVVVTEDGTTLAEFSSNAKGVSSLRLNDKGRPGFAKFVQDRLLDIHKEWEQENKAE